MVVCEHSSNTSLMLYDDVSELSRFLIIKAKDTMISILHSSVRAWHQLTQALGQKKCIFKREVWSTVRIFPSHVGQPERNLQASGSIEAKFVFQTNKKAFLYEIKGYLLRTFAVRVKILTLWYTFIFFYDLFRVYFLFLKKNTLLEIYLYVNLWIKIEYWMNNCFKRKKHQLYDNISTRLQK